MTSVQHTNMYIGCTTVVVRTCNPGNLLSLFCDVQEDSNVGRYLFRICDLQLLCARLLFKDCERERERERESDRANDSNH